MREEELKSLAWLGDILDILLEQCPWDRAQTARSLRYLTIEEVYELSETILSGNYGEMRGELGDLLMHILFYSKLAEKDHAFSLSDVADSICRKLISRHPHITLPNRDGTPIQAREGARPNWELVKMKEGRKSALEGVPKGLPPLVKSVRMQEKAAGMGFAFAKQEEAWGKVKEEYHELAEAMAHNGDGEEEFGDLLFALVGWGKFLGVNADDALSQANRKFQRRFMLMEQAAATEGKTLRDYAPQGLLALWKEAKQQA